MFACHESAVDFKPQWEYTEKSAIANAANEGCIGGGGVDGAINEAGGNTLVKDRLLLPLIKFDGNEKINEKRCLIGDAKITGPRKYD